jgi:hypothetical protein
MLRVPSSIPQKPKEFAPMLEVASPDNVKTTDRRPKDFLDPTEIKTFLEATKAIAIAPMATAMAAFSSPVNGMMETLIK